MPFVEMESNGNSDKLADLFFRAHLAFIGPSLFPDTYRTQEEFSRKVIKNVTIYCICNSLIFGFLFALFLISFLLSVYTKPGYLKDFDDQWDLENFKKEQNDP